MTPFLFGQYIFQGIIAFALGWVVVATVHAVFRWCGDYLGYVGPMLKRWSEPAFEETRRFDNRTNEIVVTIEDKKPVWMVRTSYQGWRRRA